MEHPKPTSADDPGTCPVCPTQLSSVSGGVQLALLRDWTGEPEDAPWNELSNPIAADGADWRQRYVRGFCSVEHARDHLVSGRPAEADWFVEPRDGGSDLGCIVAAVVALLVVLLVLALAVIGAREVWRVLT